MTELDSKGVDSERIAQIYHDRGPIEISTDATWFILREIGKLSGLNLAEYLNSKYLNSNDNPKVLDLCCGRGAVVFALKRNGLKEATIFGCDIFEYKFDPKENPYQKTIIGDVTNPRTLENIKKANPTGFDLITCFRPPPEIFDSIFKNLEQFTALLKPGGYIVCTNETSSDFLKKIPTKETGRMTVLKTDLPVAPIIAIYQKPEEKSE